MKMIKTDKRKATTKRNENHIYRHSIRNKTKRGYFDGVKLVDVTNEFREFTSEDLL